MFLRSTYILSRTQHVFQRKLIQTSAVTRLPTALNNILSGGPVSNVQVKKLSSRGVELEDGLILPAACIFLNGKVFLWDVPTSLWNGWTPNHLELFEIVVPKPEILLLGTGQNIVQVPHSIRAYLQKIGIQLDIMDSWNACTTYNVLTEEGRHVAAALLPYKPINWKKEMK